MRPAIQIFGLVALLSATAVSQNIEQIEPGRPPAPRMVASFDGLGVGFSGPQGGATFRNPSDNSLAVGPNHIRWQDYTQTAVDPEDDCTIWYVGDYVRKGAASYSTRIGAFQLPGCGS